MPSVAHRRNARAYQLRHRAAGLCVRCPRRVEMRAQMCRRCRERLRRWWAAGHKALRYRCGLCGVRGHTRKICDGRGERGEPHRHQPGVLCCGRAA